MLKKQKYVTAVFCLFLSFFFAAMGILQYQMIRGKKPVSTDAGIEAMNNDTVLVGGMPIGIYMETDGVMVLNTEQIAGADGKEHEPAKGIVKAGDYIMKPIYESMEANILTIFKGKTKLLVSELKDSDAAVLGASALGWELKDFEE